jgi:hypothetical protein
MIVNFTASRGSFGTERAGGSLREVDVSSRLALALRRQSLSGGPI